MTAVRLWAPPALLAGCIYGLSSLSHVPGQEYVWDKLAHVAVFGLLALLTLRAAHGGLRPLRPRPTLGAAALVIGWGALDELHQRFVPGRSAGIEDVVADAVGVLLAMGFWTVWLLRKATVPRAGDGTGGRG